MLYMYSLKIDRIMLLESAERIFENSKKTKLNPQLLKDKFSLDIKKISTYLGRENRLTTLESVLFANILGFNILNETADLFELSDHFGISAFSSPIEILPIIDSLCDKGLVFKTVSKRRANDILRQQYYQIEKNIINAIISGKPMPKREKVIWNTSIDVLQEIMTISKNIHDSTVQKQDIFATVNKIIDDIDQNKFPFLNFVKSSQLKDENLIIFSHVVLNSIMGAESAEFKELASYFFNKVGVIVFTQQLLSGEHTFIAEDLLQVHKTVFLDEIELKLSNKTIEALKLEKINVVTNEQGAKNNFIMPDQIVEQKLFYNEDAKPQINSIQEILEENKYGELISRLKLKGLPELLTVIFYGPPGTGKTETVMQLAKKSGRPIINVDMSSIRGSYFGESEKKVKAIFTNYQKLVESSDVTPILLLNEADGLLRNRADINSSSTVASTEHLIQTILLNCLESSNGIIFATTNFVESLDSAFDRRFLYKIELKKPSVLVRSKIIQNRINYLTMEETLSLAKTFELTGAQVSNILRKSEFQYVLTGEEANYNKIQSYCEEELSLQKQSRNKIGF